MSSKLSKYVPPSPFVPFVRRFTDERARDLSETIALYSEVRAAHAQSVWAKHDAIERVNSFIVEQLGEVVTLPSSAIVAAALDRCQQSVLALETTIFASREIDWSTAVLSLKEQVDLRRFLRAQQHFLANEDRVAEQLVMALGNVFGGIIAELPSLPPASSSPYPFLFVRLSVVSRHSGGAAHRSRAGRPAGMIGSLTLSTR